MSGEITKIIGEFMAVDGDGKVASGKSNKTPAGDAYLLTPGPLTTSTSVKQAMLHDLGSRDRQFIELNRFICDQLLHIADAADTHECVPLQGSGTFAVEAMLATVVPPQGKVLNLVNGAYGHRITDICTYTDRECVVQETAENIAIDVVSLEHTLANDESITHVCVIYCETTSGILNPLAQIAEVVSRHKRALLIDAMSAFGALPLNAKTISFEALVASSNKCLQGVPGMGFCLIGKEALTQSAGNAHSLSLDLYLQAEAMRKNGQWRFTPPVQCLLALAQALSELQNEGGVKSRGERYQGNCQILRAGMIALGFEPLLSEELQAPIIVTFLIPDHPLFEFQQFYDRLNAKGYVIYPGKITNAETFRIGCIGDIGPVEINGALTAIKDTLGKMGIDELDSNKS
jgi:2-aminoethylphosphonate-pyruvate transaminase